MKPYKEYEKTAKDEPPFSNGTEWEIWSYNVCMGGTNHERRCVNDDGADEGNGCPLILLSMIGKTPAEWTGPRAWYRCTEKVLPADARRAERAAKEAADREALEAQHYSMFEPSQEVP